MNQQRQYTEVTGGSNNERWEPQKSNMPIDPNNPPMLEGYYKRQREQNGANGPFLVHEIATVNPDGSLGEDLDLSGGMALDSTMEQISIGSFVCIQYLGKKPSKTPGRSYHNWKVFKDDNAIPYQKLAGMGQSQASTQAPVNKPQQGNTQGNFQQNSGQNQNWNNNPNHQANQRQQVNNPQQNTGNFNQNYQGQNFNQTGQNFGNGQNTGYQNTGARQGMNQGQQNNGVHGDPFQDDLPF
jgi:hypothetical protein